MSAGAPACPRVPRLHIGAKKMRHARCGRAAFLLRRLSAGRYLSDLLQKAGLQHETTRIRLAVHLVVAADQTDALDLGAHFEGDGRALDLQVLDDHYRVAIGQHIAIGIPYHRIRGVVGGCGLRHRPFIAAVGANIVVAVLIGVFQSALGAGGDSGHDFAQLFRSNKVGRALYKPGDQMA
jgi:hypothetical protein